MNDRTKNVLLLGLGLGLAFSLGQHFGGCSGEGGRNELQAGPIVGTPTMPAPQGRRVGGNTRVQEPPSGTGAESADEAPLVWESGSGGSAAARDLIAVTGSYGVGTSVLYVIDAKRRQLAVYEARGGSRAGRRVVLVGARRIDLDLQLEGYRDESEHSYDDLRGRFERKGLLPQPAAEGDPGKGGSGSGGGGR